ncbi:helix-turn-helix domain-containing protein [Roseibium polysiphoniae]|uniref:Helix-turn-helix domain-containing protein n=1 Tax=Roseibium polysiphoniae TaxID=2571221 RepID=A0ABR9C8L6_9HYPH|nr:helix-turn-helix domain-containing protein [Roseibium polysiphoniae]MBD8875420.1 helix-turn-helix domain-containing protein [Roseibium polysiphoniae]
MSDLKRRPRMSIIPAEAVNDPNVSPVALKVLAALGRHTDRAGFCFRSLRKLADELALARCTVQRAVASLIEAGWLIRFRNHRKDGGDCSSTFRVLLRQRKRDRNGTFRTEDDGQPPQRPHYAPAEPDVDSATDPDSDAETNGGTDADTDAVAGILEQDAPPEEDAIAQPGRLRTGSPHKNDPIKTKSGNEPGEVRLPKRQRQEAAYVREVKRRLSSLGWVVTPGWFRQGDAPIRAWFAGGCDIDRDVMPPILNVLLNGGGRPSSLSYFTKAVFRAKNARVAIENLSPDDPLFRNSRADKDRAERRAYFADFEAVAAEISSGALS